MGRIQSVAALLTMAILIGCGDEGADDRLELDDTTRIGASDTAAMGDAEGLDTGPSGRALGTATLPGGDVYLTDQAGRPLYVLGTDRGGDPTCLAECTEHWPPFMAEPDLPAADDPRLQQDLVGSTERDDEETRQTTYADHPLYYYVEDTEAGRTSGHGHEDEWGTWYLVGPDGEPLALEGGA